MLCEVRSLGFRILLVGTWLASTSARMERRSVGSIVVTPFGAYQGAPFYFFVSRHLKLIWQRLGKILSRVEQWLGIPFAEVPIGDLRFAPPQALTPSNDTTVQPKIAFGPRCGQYTDGVS